MSNCKIHKKNLFIFYHICTKSTLKKFALFCPWLNRNINSKNVYVNTFHVEKCISLKNYKIGTETKLSIAVKNIFTEVVSVSK